MNNIDKPINQLLDIILPPAPPVAIDYSSMLISLSIVIFIMAILTYNIYRSGFKYKVSIYFLKKKLLASHLTPRQTAYKLASIFYAAHNVQHLAEINIAVTSSQKKCWQEFTLKLSNFRYGKPQISLRDTLNLLDKAMSWTRRCRP